jgi:hypothetical protein
MGPLEWIAVLIHCTRKSGFGRIRGDLSARYHSSIHQYASLPPVIDMRLPHCRYHELSLDGSCALQHNEHVSSILLQENRFSPLPSGLFFACSVSAQSLGAQHASVCSSANVLNLSDVRVLTARPELT